MRIFTSLIMLFIAILTSCQTGTVGEGPWVKKVDSEEASRLVIFFSNEMKERFGLELEDSRMTYDDDIRRFYLEYSSQKLMTVYDARLMLVELVEEFLRRVNNHSVLSFELECFPLTARDVEVKINFESFYGLYADPLYVGQVWLNCGCVRFYAFDRKNNDIDWDHHRFEPYFKSRELALIKKEADTPALDKDNFPAKPTSFIYDRYIPQNP
jgi:hypothetical protein